MCGIVGALQLFGRGDVDALQVQQMNEMQRHRGPDEGGLHVEPGVALGHRRLSIIDLSTGKQPLTNEDGSVIVVYNGEIYNFQSIRRELAALGHQFRTHSDTEIIVHGWEEWGESCVERFRGMFAFAVWDRRQETLFLARDQLGIKPLHYTLLSNGQLLFASELKALLQHPGCPRELIPEAIEDYFAYGYVPDPKTIFRGIWKLPPGHRATIRRGDTTLIPKKYWDVPFAPQLLMSEAQVAEELIERMKESVKLCMISDVPLGAFLSGGVDSSAVVAMMAGLSDRPVSTCSIAFDDPRFNEAAFARLVATRYHTNHSEHLVKGEDLSLIDGLSRVYDEPFADSSSLPTYRLCEQASRHVKVALSGDGGDESFAGYEWYRFHVAKERIRRCVPDGLRPLLAALGHIYPKLDFAPRMLRAKTTLETLAMDPVDSYARSVMLSTTRQRQMLFSNSFKRTLQGYNAAEVLKEHARNAPVQDPLSLVQYLDFKTYLPGDILTKVDRASMAHSLEVRVPLLDHLFVAWVSGLSPRFKLRGRTSKYILKKSLEPHLPRDVLYRRKMGFSVPLAKWLRGPLCSRLDALVQRSALADSGLLNMSAIRTFIDQHQSGRYDHTGVLWPLLVFDAFQRNVLGAE